MSAVFSHTASGPALDVGASAHRNGPTEAHALRHPLRGTRAFAALLLAGCVAALVVIADQMISSWTDDHLFLGWVALWMVVLAGTALFAAPARLLARRVLPVLRGIADLWVEARAAQRMWEAGQRDPRLHADLAPSRKLDLADGSRSGKASAPVASTAEPARCQGSRWERFIEHVDESRRYSGHKHLYY